jgi:hypothetical protein
LSKVVSRGWRRFRRLSPVAQIGVAGVIVLAYTGAIVGGLLLLLGGSGTDGSKPRPPTALERKLRATVTSAKVFQQEMGDVAGFRRPKLQSVRCDSGDCAVTYFIAVPGRGRMLEQQTRIVRQVFLNLPIHKLKLEVKRGVPTGPLAKSPPGGEETIPGLLLMVTNCDLGHETPATLRPLDGYSTLQRLCKTQLADGSGELRGGGTSTLPSSATDGSVKRKKP